MDLYRELNLEMVKAIQNGTLDTFIQRLNQRLAANPRDYMAWLFVARAYDAKGDIENSVNSYKQLMRIADPNARNSRLALSEVLEFAARTSRNDLIAVIKERFGAQLVDQLTQSTTQARPKKVHRAPADKQTKPKPTTTKRDEDPPQVTADKQAKSKATATNSDVDIPQPPVDKPTKSKPKTTATKKDGDAPQPTTDKLLKVRTAKPTTSPDLDSYNLVGESRKAFDNGNLEVALNKAEEAYNAGVRNSQLYQLLAQTLQRLQRFDDAQSILDEGIHTLKVEQQPALFNLRAQIYSTQKDWEKACNAYVELIRVERRPEARRFAQLQLARIYRRLGETDKAITVLDTLLQESPEDQVAQRLRATFSSVVDVSSGRSDVVDDEALNELEVDVSDEGIELISPMLRRDLTITEYRDEAILMKGGQPDTSDADRLLGLAESLKSSEFGERYPLFLEAAKAYNDLPEGSYELEKFYRALTRYAMLRGSAYISEFRRRILSGQSDIEMFRRLRDSATSYYLESLALQARVDSRYALVPLTNHLRVQIAFALSKQGQTIPAALFNQSFADLFKMSLDDPNDDIVRIAYESVVACGAASGRVWNQLRKMPGGPGIMWQSLEKPNRRRRPYGILSQMSDDSFSISARPGEVLRSAFLARRRQIQSILTFFIRVQQTPLDVPNFRELEALWRQFPIYRGTLLDTDMELHAGVEAILATLLPYQSRSQEERTAMLFSARTNIENLHRFIQENPTYWGRIGFEPLLTRWKSAIRSIEARRVSEIQPKLQARLEPPVFQRQGDYVVGGLSLQNVGRGTAEGATIWVRLSTYNDNEVLSEFKDTINKEIAVGATLHYPIQFDKASLLQDATRPYRIHVLIAPIFRNIELEASGQEFTLEIHSGARLDIRDIPWNEIEIPPEYLFKGRQDFIALLAKHIQSNERNKSYILYGLTRTGKSSILRYLARELDLMPLQVKGNSFRCVSFSWDMGQAKAQSSARDMWTYLLRSQVIDKLHNLAKAGDISFEALPILKNDENIRFRDWPAILQHLSSHSLYPTFLVDEFSYYRELVDSRRVDAAFLAAIRSFAIEGMASFVFAGTYDLRRLIEDPSYGITGQFVNALETKVSRIEESPAIELILAMEPKLQFTDEAIAHMLHLSYRIPYFIQILCKNCAIYAARTGRTIIGFPELERVVEILVGEVEDREPVGLSPLAAGVFMNNMHSPTDPVEYSTLLSTICDLNRGRQHSRPATYMEIQEIWHRADVTMYQARLAKALQELCDREVLLASEDEGMPAYRISVDLFRRWWANEHKFLNLELDIVKQETN